MNTEYAIKPICAEVALLTATWGTNSKACIASWYVDVDGNYAPKWEDMDKKTPSKLQLAKIVKFLKQLK